ncbi:hypothetical protein FOCC_FOCC011552 [Frankliniella occidentalis]|nr:hypothetical protein FOCC_FOCC011552 [Frankliniella occidentalis]
MMRNPPLPLLPGNDFDRKIGQTRFHKSQHFGNVHKLSMLLDKRLPGIGGAPMPHVPHARWPSIYCRGDVAALPAWLAFDKETLVFDAYFKEALQEVEGSPFLPRYVKIYFYLEDGTIQVQEPRKVNSGIHQGVFISRQRIRFPPDSRSETFVDIVDLNIGYEVELYGRVFKIVNCDRFTRNFLNRMGIMVPDPITMPEDPYMERRFKAGPAAEDFTPKPYPPEDDVVFDSVPRPELPPYNGYGSHEDSSYNCRTIYPVAPVKDLKQFLRKDREGMDSRVLRFSAQMISNIPHLSKRPFIISFYLADDTLTVFENVRVNSGFQGGMFFSRDKFVKPGENLFGSEPPACYSKEDCYIGALLELRDFKFLLTGADEYALRYMELNCSEFPKSNIRQILQKVRERVRPVYKQFVSEQLGVEALRSGRAPYKVLRRALTGLLGTQHDLSWMSHAPTVEASEVAVDAFLGELGLEEDLRASCGDAAKPCGSAAVVPADAPGLLGAGWGEDGDGPAHRAPGRYTVTFAGLD